MLSNILFGLALLPAATAFGSLSALPASHPPIRNTAGWTGQPDETIKCAFLRMVVPDTTNMFTFLSDVVASGLDSPGAVQVANLVVSLQQGNKALVEGKAPDIYRLAEVPGISHLDLYLPFIENVTAMLEKAENAAGEVTLQDLIDVKVWIAKQVNVLVSAASQTETEILFIRAGGNLQTGTIPTTDVLALVQGFPPKHLHQVGGKTVTMLKALPNTAWPVDAVAPGPSAGMTSEASASASASAEDPATGGERSAASTEAVCGASSDCPTCAPLDNYQMWIMKYLRGKQLAWCNVNTPASQNSLPVCKAQNLVMPMQYPVYELGRLVMSPDKSKGGPAFAVPNTRDENEAAFVVVQPTPVQGADGIDGTPPPSYATVGSDETMGSWPAGGFPQTIMNSLIGGAPPDNIFPNNRILTPWGTDKYTDAAMSRLVFEGIGQIRVEPMRADDTLPTLHNVAGAVHAVYLGFMEALEVKEGFAKYGAIAYFDAAGSPLAIYRLGTMFTPDSPNSQWAAAKGAFRGSLMVIITVWDHLARLHLSLSNGLVTANTRHLAPTHPVRLLLSAHTFNTIGVNRGASYVLVNEYGMLMRSTSLSGNGLRLVLGAAFMADQISASWLSVPATMAKRGFATYQVVDGTGTAVPNEGMEDFQLAYDQDAAYYFGILTTYVQAAIDGIFGDDDAACSNDESLQAWYTEFRAMQPHPTSVPAFTGCDSLVEILATVLFAVTAQHNHVGTLGAEVEDPCFTPMSWLVVDEDAAMNGTTTAAGLCPPPRNAVYQAILFGTTGFGRIVMVDDWNQLIPTAALPAYNLFKESLYKWWVVLQGRNVARVTCGKRDFLTFDPNRMETGVSV